MCRILFVCMLLTSIVAGCKRTVDTPHFVVVSNHGQPILAIRLRANCRCSVWYVDEKGGMIGDEIEGALTKAVDEYFKMRLRSRRCSSDATIVLQKDVDGDSQIVDEYRNIESVVQSIPPRAEDIKRVSQEIIEMLSKRDKVKSRVDEATPIDAL